MGQANEVNRSAVALRARLCQQALLSLEVEFEVGKAAWNDTSEQEV